MMTMRNILTAGAAMALATSATVAHADVVRAAPEAAKESEMGGGKGMMIYILAAAAVVIGVLILADGDDDDTPVSP